MGEIGFRRPEFLYDLVWWEIKSIIRGYNSRQHAGWEQARLIAYTTRFCMGSKTTPPPVNQWIKFPWEQQRPMEVPQEVIDELQAEMKAMNEQRHQK